MCLRFKRAVNFGCYEINISFYRNKNLERHYANDPEVSTTVIGFPKLSVIFFNVYWRF